MKKQERAATGKVEGLEIWECETKDVVRLLEGHRTRLAGAQTFRDSCQDALLRMVPVAVAHEVTEVLRAVSSR